jgi:hypothetical protein
MPSLDEITQTLWDTKRPALNLLASTGCARAAATVLSAEERAPFDALSAALLAWGTDRKRAPRDILQAAFVPCQDLYGSSPEHVRLVPAMESAHHQMEALRMLAPGSITLHELGAQDGYDAASLTKLVRILAKLTKTDLETWKGRFDYLLSFTTLSAKDAAWPELVAKTARIGFDRPMRGVKELGKSLQELARVSDLGATSSWSTMGPKHALTLQLGTTKRTAMLDDEQRASLLQVLPWLA